MDFDRRRSPAASAFLHDARRNPYFSLALAFGFGIPSALIAADAGLWSLVFLAPAAFLLYRGVRQLRSWHSRRPEARPGGEKLLLVTLCGAGGSITPVEAALATSLTVDEAEGMLSRLAERGHLRVEVRDGTLHYTLPEAPRKGPLESWPGSALQ